MTEQLNGKQVDTTPEYLYLRNIHDSTIQNEIDLHTYFYLKDMEVCPICNDWLVMRGKTEVKP